MTMKRTKFNIRTIAVTGMLGALATVLMFLEFPIPMLIPPFIKFDFSELPALLAAYAMGPVSGIAVCFIKNVINLLHTQTGGVGELSNFILGVCFVLPAGLIYKRKKTQKMGEGTEKLAQLKQQDTFQLTGPMGLYLLIITPEIFFSLPGRQQFFSITVHTFTVPLAFLFSV